MGFLNLTYISNHSLLFVVLGIVAVVGITYHVKKNWRGKRKAYRAGVMAYHADTNPHIVRRRVFDTIARTENDDSMFIRKAPYFMHDVNRDVGPGGPLHELIKERRSGIIDKATFKEKMTEYIRQKAAGHSIPQGRRFQTNIAGAARLIRS